MILVMIPPCVNLLVPARLRQAYEKEPEGIIPGSFSLCRRVLEILAHMSEGDNPDFTSCFEVKMPCFPA
jgi:hypothetical protein